ncbi:hypothetical protein AN958_12316 [Leucoagaricus sp. SymC.cos]|nr:hypothetical protein AN958_12316 [Leucoagaricus sp. SymC.cos]
MFEPVRGGTRGGQAEFKWSDVSADKDREHYLGHSINAPTGRWQKNKDVHWYNRDKKDTEDEKQEEVRRIKQLEADALAVALGFEPAPKDAKGEPSSSSVPMKPETDEDALARAKEKEERRRKKAERREEKAAKKQAKLERKGPGRDRPVGLVEITLVDPEALKSDVIAGNGEGGMTMTPRRERGRESAIDDVGT